MSKKNQNMMFLGICALNMILFGILMDTNGSTVRDYFQGFVVGINGVAFFLTLWSLAKERKRA
ncbi:hypothetical protein [Paenibacillus donghaensis]|uniref:Uncharacterized protein n=1 Tax=Paenibacillus donghaensis TaxID=414771 RepID=A0A2Z2KVW1_9BACL|nr:hypothetical protein [Paenibacillus donghaensis]ASA25481.1 hypothetical protein B9T62_34980 [Paenibacillus donghaensis]